MPLSLRRLFFFVAIQNNNNTKKEIRKKRNNHLLSLSFASSFRVRAREREKAR